jgi:hypothetical protein
VCQEISSEDTRAYFETGGRHFETVLGIQEAELHGKNGLHRLPMEADFVCDNAPATAAVLRPEIRDALCSSSHIFVKMKWKVVPVIKYHTTRTYEGRAFLISLDRATVSASCPICITSKKKVPQYPLDRRLDGSQNDYGHDSEAKNLCTNPK